MKPKTKLEAALQYLERGWSIIPIKPEAKRPAIKRQDFQSLQPTEEEVTEWWTRWPDHEIAIVTGELSGVVVVDCDNEEAAHAAFDANMRSPIKVKTKRGSHLYFEHPKYGTRRGHALGEQPWFRLAKDQRPGFPWRRIICLASALEELCLGLPDRRLRLG